ncbi:MAG: DUF6492 family protein [Halieaceae bacterium]|jgi:hypothetical protein|nr:DUF6492 family protein [Halieaceae bacterium]
MTIDLITVSYGPDLARCRRLCATIDRHVRDHRAHLVIIPRRDLAAFRDLEGPKRRVVTIESMMPGLYWQLPFSNWSVVAGLRPIPRLAAMRGWIVQQLVKLGTAAATDAEVLCMIDSDVQFCRSFSARHFLHGDRVRLQTVAWDTPPSSRHPRWQATAEGMLGLAQAHFERDYIGNLITWRRDHLLSMLNHIEETHGKPWYIVAGRGLRFSEYILYGNYVDRVLGGESGHVNECPHYCFELWDQAEVAELQRGDSRLKDEQVAVLIQSKLGLDEREERELIAMLEAQDDPVSPCAETAPCASRG